MRPRENYTSTELQTEKNKTRKGILLEVKTEIHTFIIKKSVFVHCITYTAALQGEKDIFQSVQIKLSFPVFHRFLHTVMMSFS